MNLQNGNDIGIVAKEPKYFYSEKSDKSLNSSIFISKLSFSVKHLKGFGVKCEINMHFGTISGTSLIKFNITARGRTIYIYIRT